MVPILRFTPSHRPFNIGVQNIVVFYLGMSTLHERLNHSMSWHLKLGEIKTHSFINSFHVFQLPANETWAKRLRGSCISNTLQFASQSQVPSLFRCLLTNKEHIMLLWKTRSLTHLWCEISQIFNRSPKIILCKAEGSDELPSRIAYESNCNFGAHTSLWRPRNLKIPVRQRAQELPLRWCSQHVWFKWPNFRNLVTFRVGVPIAIEGKSSTLIQCKIPPLLVHVNFYAVHRPRQRAWRVEQRDTNAAAKFE